MQKNYNNDFKVRVILEVLREEQTISQIASKYDLHPTQINRWKKIIMEGIPTLLTDKRKKDAKEAETAALIQELYAQIGELTSKLNWLKKKSGIDVK